MDQVELVRRTWQAWSEGDFATIEAALAPDARWLAVEDGPWNCESRAQMLELMRKNRERGGGPNGDVEQITSVGARVVVAFRPQRPDPGGWPLDEGIRYVVLSIADGLVTEMKGCASRQVAFDYAAA